jgi:ATP-binding cassette subfamily B protein
MLGAVLTGMVWTAAKVSVPELAGRAIDHGVIPSNADSLVSWVLLMLVVGLVQAAATGLRRYLAFRCSLRAEADLRQRMFAHYQRLHFAFHDRAGTGQLMARANTDLQQIHELLVLIPITIANILTLVAIATRMVTINPRLTLFALLPLPFLNVLATRFSARIHPAVLALQERLADVSTVAEETVSGVRVIKGFGSERLQVGRLDRVSDEVFATSMRAARLRSAFMPALDLLPMLGLVAILWLGGHEVLAGRLTEGELVQFSVYVLMLVWPLRLTGVLFAQAARASASAGRVHEVLSTEPEIAERPGARRLPDGPGAIRFEGVRFGYPGNPPVLDGLDLDIRGGEALALVGPTGCGKSTVARLIPRFYDVDAGRVLVDGADVRDLRLAALRQAVAVVFEDTFLFSDTVRSNIAFARPDAPFEAVEWAARLAGAHDFVATLPDGYDSILGEQGFSLSGGQRQRIAIARAILADPRILILDDATSSVDPTKEHEIRSALEQVMRGRTTLIIAHRPATIALADRVVLLEEGRIVAEGTHEGLLVTSPEYRAVLARAEAEERAAAAEGDGQGAGVVAP